MSILQYRADYGPRKLQIEVENSGSSDLTVTGASFVSRHFAEDAAWTRATEVPSGTIRDLPVFLATTECTPASDAADLVRLLYELPDGTRGSTTVTPLDSFDVIRKVVAQDCIEQRTEEIAELTLASSLRTETRDGELVALLDLSVAPTSAQGSVTIDSVDRTILLRPPVGDGWPVALRVDAAAAPTVVTLDILPANCRFHTVAEDKRGTFFPIRVTTSDGLQGVFYLPASNEVTEQLYQYIADYCGWS